MNALSHQGEIGDLLGDRGAELSDCGYYRYRLWRRWADGPRALFVMLNPSTADALRDDNTIRKCVGFAQRWGAGRLDVVNLYAWRATDKEELRDVRGPVGEFGPYWYTTTAGPFQASRNDVMIRDAAEEAHRIVAAWGAWPGPIKSRPERVLDILREHGRVPVEALRLTKTGQPWHPLYVPYAVEPVVMEHAA